MRLPPASTPDPARRLGRHAAIAFRPQSLASGTIGKALLHIERARAGHATWQDVHGVIATVTREPLIATQDASLFFGAPAVAFVLHCAAAETGRYAAALRTLDDHVAKLTTRRLSQANQRIDRGDYPSTAEFDLFRGLTGFGAYLLRWQPGSDLLLQVLAYLVSLTFPLPGDEQLPGWWTRSDPASQTSPEFSGGHGNLGMAHGVSGPLALLGLAMRHGRTVDGHAAAIRRICTWLDAQRREADSGPWWPQWITLPEQRSGTVRQAGPARPSWCYGTPGLARAQQLAGIALTDIGRQEMAEQALLGCLEDPSQLALLGDAGLCHGAAGLLHATRCVARDARPGTFADHLPRLRALLLSRELPGCPGLLEGDTGPKLVVLSGDTGITASGWDACLLTGSNPGAS